MNVVWVLGWRLVADEGIVSFCGDVRDGRPAVVGALQWWSRRGTSYVVVRTRRLVRACVCGCTSRYHPLWRITSPTSRRQRCSSPPPIHPPSDLHPLRTRSSKRPHLAQHVGPELGGHPDAPRLRTKRVKEARDEAKKEIAEYRANKEDEFKKFESEHSRGNKEAEDEASKEADSQIKTIREAGQKGQAAVVKNLLSAVFDVTPVPPSKA
ncbi:V-type proton ATPase subunit G [Tolypocladium paradoxum]|uniref:V-type proton ATPase subunit G n=1 Tax=Tolypocladium paradoxum TaxID=94208 RepID=A0A2S4L1K8_9HYPO|nr:V-type proton ATPase subunit G [Tolypocladium paradoxum]